MTASQNKPSASMKELVILPQSAPYSSDVRYVAFLSADDRPKEPGIYRLSTTLPDGNQRIAALKVGAKKCEIQFDTNYDWIEGQIPDGFFKIQINGAHLLQPIKGKKSKKDKSKKDKTKSRKSTKRNKKEAQIKSDGSASAEERRRARRKRRKGKAKQAPEEHDAEMEELPEEGAQKVSKTRSGKASRESQAGDQNPTPGRIPSEQYPKEGSKSEEYSRGFEAGGFGLVDEDEYAAILNA